MDIPEIELTKQKRVAYIQSVFQTLIKDEIQPALDALRPVTKLKTKVAKTNPIPSDRVLRERTKNQGHIDTKEATFHKQKERTDMQVEEVPPKPKGTSKRSRSIKYIEYEDKLRDFLIEIVGMNGGSQLFPNAYQIAMGASIHDLTKVVEDPLTVEGLLNKDISVMLKSLEKRGWTDFQLEALRSWREAEDEVGKKR